MSEAFIQAKKVVRAYVLATLDDRTRTLVRLANADLHFGPVHNGLDESELALWEGFEKATIEISAALHDLSDLWVEGDNVAPSEPEGYTDEETGEWVAPFLEDTYHFEYRDVLRATFGELADYLQR